MKFFATNLDFDKELMAVSMPLLNIEKLYAEVDTTPRKKALLKGLGIENNLDLLSYLPFRYEDYTKTTSVYDVLNKKIEGKVTMLVTLKSISFRPTKNKKTSMITGQVVDKSVRDGGGALSVVWFNQPWLIKQVKPGDWMLLIGNVKQQPRLQLVASITKKGEKPSTFLEPVYPASESISSQTIWSLIEENLGIAQNIVDPIPAHLLQKLGFLSKRDAILTIHRAQKAEHAEFAGQRLAFEELLLWEIGQAYKQNQNSKHPAFVLPKKLPVELSDWTNKLPFELSEDQQRVIGDIESDMTSGMPMNRLLMGEVGSGKAQPKTCKVLTPHGFVNMGDLKVGDEILSPTGEESHVTGIFPQGTQNTYKVVFDDESSALCSSNHLWKVCDQKGDWQVKTTLEIQESLHQKWSIPLPEPLTYQGMDSVANRKRNLFAEVDEHGEWTGNQAACLFAGFDRQTIECARSLGAKVWQQKSTLYFSFSEKRQIKKVELVGQDDMQCISVSHPSRLYITDSFVITHNTIVSEWAMLRTAIQGWQGVMLAPTETLAEQHYRSLSATLPANFQPVLLTSAKTAKQRKAILDSIKMGEAKILVGTHSLLSKDIEFPHLALLVVDEQHRFGVAQRAALAGKGEKEKLPHVLHMSATPIPRSLALTVYGDLKQSSITKKPNDRKPPQTLLVGLPKWEKVLQKIDQVAKRGEQVFVVCPAVEEDNTMDLHSVNEEFSILKALYPHHNPVLLHGSMPSEEKEAVMQDFAEKKSMIMVATTVIEVGVDVPNATLIVIKGAERFGIAQLHQLRGRVGRGDKPGLCILVGNPHNARLQALRDTDNGFKLAEIDLQQRGFGDFLGTRQHGLSGFRIAKLPEDEDLLQRAHQIAKQIIQKDPELGLPEHYLLRQAWDKTYGGSG